VPEQPQADRPGDTQPERHAQIAAAYLCPQRRGADPRAQSVSGLQLHHFRLAAALYRTERHLPANESLQVISTYLCPSDSSTANGKSETPYGGANQWGVSNYGANYQVFGNPKQGNVYGASASIPKTFVDGTSNIVMFTEMYGTCCNWGDINSCYGSLWADSNSIWRALFGTNTTYKDPAGAGYPSAFLFQVQPHYLNSCSPDRPNSPHTGGINACLGDGSVRFVTQSLSQATWAQAVNPQDGVPLNSDW
jgi:prepilin-type processing-associated H-X9-DG protein